MMIVRVRVHRENLVAHAKRRLAPRFNLVRLWERQTELAELREWGCWHLYKLYVEGFVLSKLAKVN